MNALHTCIGLLCAATLGSANAEITVTVTQGEETDLAAIYDTADLLQGLIATELPGDIGWHSANTDPLDKLPAFTDGQGLRTTGLTGLLNDYPGAGKPAKLIEYVLPVPADIHEIRMFTGNDGRDGRVFHIYTVRFSSNWGQTYSEPVYVQSHPSGTINNPATNWRVALSQLTNTAGVLASEVTYVRFDLYAVDNTQGQMRDPFAGVNPFTGTDDGLTIPVASPLVWEIDVLGADSPPRLAALVSANDVQLVWLSRAPNVILQSATQLDSPDWADLIPQPVIERTGATNRTSLVIGTAPQFFRLKVGQ